ncbi:alpha/beta hydrolase [Hirschia baltica]|uniref:Alpha/beta hydrolase fold protein n=1 Tax=Hirschia baltica (strain ATCC 49814 / DSM 5838 / IFAM 1418) TaxID=582402 RepID=C6XQN2_HIRBI|nr:alpha/beta hydrolase [Hirschia baltica]ACT58638.1 alpha/beta hydrolase fold protein [Hirschia baltica ATCC 49814]
MLRRFRVELDSGEVAGISFGEPTQPTQALFLHANGFNAMTYQSILQPLGNMWHVSAIDLRGHGRTRLETDPKKLKSWNVFRDDVIQVIEKIAPEGLVLAGHSMGATIAMLVAGKRPDLVKGIVLADPVILSPLSYMAFHIPLLSSLIGSQIPQAKGSLKRRVDFSSSDEAESNLAGRGAFKTWRTPFLIDYLSDGLVPTDGVACRLACDPAWEAACFKSQRNRPWSALHSMKKQRYPFILLQAEKNSTSISDIDERIHAFRPDAAVTRVPGTTHFLPMERPYVLRDAIKILVETAAGLNDGTDYLGAVKRTINASIGQIY